MGFTRNGADADDLARHNGKPFVIEYPEGYQHEGVALYDHVQFFINNYKRKKFQNTVLDSTENHFINASQDYRVDTVTTVINQSDILEAIDELKQISASRLQCSWMATTTTKLRKKWTFPWGQ